MNHNSEQFTAVELVFFLGEYLAVPILLFFVVLAQKAIFREEKLKDTHNIMDYGVEFMTILVASTFALTMRLHKSQFIFYMLVVVIFELFLLLLVIGLIKNNYNNKLYRFIVPANLAFAFFTTLINVIIYYYVHLAKNSIGIITVASWVVLVLISHYFVLKLTKNYVLTASDHILDASRIEVSDQTNARVLASYIKAADKAIKYSGLYMQAISGARAFCARNLKGSSKYYLYTLKLIDAYLCPEYNNTARADSLIKEMESITITRINKQQFISLVRDNIKSDEYKMKLIDEFNAIG